MTATTLVASGLISLAMASVYAYVGVRLTQREVAVEARHAVYMFGLWWFALAGLTGLTTARTLLAAAGIVHLGLFVVVTYVNLFLLAIALLGLVYYLVYLFSGRHDTLAPVTACYLVFFFLLAATVSSATPVGVDVTGWDASLTFEAPPTGTVIQAVLLLFLGPPLVGALAYMSQLFRVEDRTQRYRIGLVSASIVLWFGSAYGVSLLGAGDALWWTIGSKLIGLGAALTILAAYLPPGWIRERLGVEPLGHAARSGLRPDRSAPG